MSCADVSLEEAEQRIVPPRLDKVPNRTVIQGDCYKHLATLPADSIDCVVTSPPYWALRKYDIGGSFENESKNIAEIGAENSIGAYVHKIKYISRIIRRALKPSRDVLAQHW